MYILHVYHLFALTFSISRFTPMPRTPSTRHYLLDMSLFSKTDLSPADWPNFFPFHLKISEPKFGGVWGTIGVAGNAILDVQFGWRSKNRSYWIWPNIWETMLTGILKTILKPKILILKNFLRTKFQSTTYGYVLYLVSSAMCERAHDSNVYIFSMTHLHF